MRRVRARIAVIAPTCRHERRGTRLVVAPCMHSSHEALRLRLHADALAHLRRGEYRDAIVVMRRLLMCVAPSDDVRGDLLKVIDFTMMQANATRGTS